MTTRTKTHSPIRTSTNPIDQRRTLARSSTATLLRYARARAGLSQIQLANLAGTSQPAIARYERGIVRPRSDTLERILEVCGADASDLSRPDRPLLGPVGMLALAKRRSLGTILADAGSIKVRVIGPVAEAIDTEDSPLELAVTLSPDSASLGSLATTLSEDLGHEVILHDLSAIDPALLQGARTL